MSTPTLVDATRNVALAGPTWQVHDVSGRVGVGLFES